jgi:hypothetical protein
MTTEISFSHINSLLRADMDGYAKIATLMGAYPEVGIVRRFAALNAQNILYMQAELINLESRLRRYEKEDRESGDQARRDYAVNWFKLRYAADPPGCSDALSESTGKSIQEKDEKDDKGDVEIYRARRWETMLEIREKLYSYSTYSFPGLYATASLMKAPKILVLPR